MFNALTVCRLHCDIKRSVHSNYIKLQTPKMPESLMQFKGCSLDNYAKINIKYSLYVRDRG